VIGFGHEIRGFLTPVRGLRSRRTVVVGAAIAIAVAVIGSTVAVADISATSPSPTPTADVTGAPTLTPAPLSTLASSPRRPRRLPPRHRAPRLRRAWWRPHRWVWLPASEAELATRKPIAVMIDDLAAARPQSGLSMANIVYQAPAEGGIPRYMALFQTQAPAAIGPIRSARLYFVAWAEEWAPGMRTCGARRTR